MGKVKKCVACDATIVKGGEFDTLCFECYLKSEYDARLDMNDLKEEQE